MENKRVKNSVGTTIVIILLMLVIIALVGYMAYDKGYIFNKKEVTTKEDAKNNKSDKNNKVITNLEVTDSIVQQLYSNVGLDIPCLESVYFKDKKVVASDIDKDYATRVLFNKLGYSVSTFTKSQVDDIFNSIYGKNYKYVHGNMNGCPTVTYDSNSEIYTVATDGCGFTCGPSDLKKIVKAERTSNDVSIYFRVLFLEDNAGNNYDYYKDYKKTQRVDLKIDEAGFPEDIDSNYAKGSLYKMTFVKENNNYVFKESNLVEE